MDYLRDKSIRRNDFSIIDVWNVKYYVWEKYLKRNKNKYLQIDKSEIYLIIMDC